MPYGIYKHKPHSEETKIKMSLAHRGNTHGFKKGFTSLFKGKKHTEESKIKNSISHLGKKASQETKLKMKARMTGEGNTMYGKSGILSPVWIENRDNVVIIPNQERRSNPYLFWRRTVCNRDSWKCRIDNKDCDGKLEVHHILGFKEHPKLRYDINNGIALCHFHHPRKRSEEANLSPFFQKLVAELN
jgi:hypothetical protein